MNRRDFLKLSSVSASVVMFDALTPANAKANPSSIVATNGFSMLQGLTTETSTQLSIDVPKTMVVHYQLMDASNGRLMDPFYLKTMGRDASDWRVDKVAYKNLPYLGKFIFRALDNKGQVIDERNLGLLDLNKKNPRLAFMSCMLDTNNNVKKIWPRVEAANCDMMFFVGDNVYGDELAFIDSPDLLWKNSIKTRQKLPFYHWKNLKPVLCLWDDHDYGLNNADGTYQYKDISIETFKAFTAQDPIVDCFERGPGISSIFRAFGQKFVLLDNRYFKNLPHSGIKKGFLGKEQLDWAFSKMSQSNGPNWIMEGSQFFLKGGSEGYLTQAPEEMAIFAAGINGLNSPCTFVAGDVHYTEVSKLPKNILDYETVEITSSSLHSYTKSKLPPNPDRLYGAAKENYVFVDLVPSGQDLVFDIQGIGIDKVWFSDRISI